MTVHKPKRAARIIVVILLAGFVWLFAFFLSHGVALVRHTTTTYTVETQPNVNGIRVLVEELDPTAQRFWHLWVFPMVWFVKGGNPYGFSIRLADDNHVGKRYRIYSAVLRDQDNGTSLSLQIRTLDRAGVRLPAEDWAEFETSPHIAFPYGFVICGGVKYFPNDKLDLSMFGSNVLLVMGLGLELDNEKVEQEVRISLKRVKQTGWSVEFAT